jgi:hypothetical protein
MKYIHSSIALEPFVGPWLLFQFLNLYTVGRTPWTGISPSQGRYLHTGQYNHRINAHTDIHALSGIRNHFPSVRAGEDCSYLRPRGHCDQQMKYIMHYYFKDDLRIDRLSKPGCFHFHAATYN